MSFLMYRLGQPEPVAQVVRALQRRKPDRPGFVPAPLHRQQLVVAPQRGRAGGDGLPRDGLADGRVVELRFQRSEIKLADVRGLQWVGATALATAKRQSRGHADDPWQRRRRRCQRMAEVPYCRVTRLARVTHGHGHRHRPPN